MLALTAWEDLEKLARFLEQHYGASILERIDGPDARRWIVAVRGVTIELQHEDPWGNVIVAPDASAEPLLREIADDLTRRLTAAAREPERDGRPGSADRAGPKEP